MGFEFDKLISSLVAQGRTLPKFYTKSWHVRRAEYDSLLLETTMEHGVEVRFGAHVREILLDKKGGRVTGLTFSDDQGLHTVSSTWVMDCSGQDGVLARKFGLRRYDERMNNYALWGYWRGAKWRRKYVGHPNLARIFVATTPRGWIWYIPVHPNIISVGFVTHRAILREGCGDPQSVYRNELLACPEIEGLLEGAELIRISPDQQRDVCVIRDWSYDSRHVVGEGWAMAGDAAGFVDPILSSGVMLAHELGQKAAYTINSSFQAMNDKEIQTYWNFYQDTYRTYLHAYRDMAAFWYANNFAMESWWWEARRALKGSQSSVDLTSAEAFMRIASGYANRAESLSLFGSYPLSEAYSLVDGLFGVSQAPQIENDYVGRTFCLNSKAQLREGFYFYRGAVRETRRVVNTENNLYLDLHAGEDVLLDLLDGYHTPEDVDHVITRIRRTDGQLPIRSGRQLFVQLDRIGVLT